MCERINVHSSPVVPQRLGTTSLSLYTQSQVQSFVGKEKYRHVPSKDDSLVDDL